MTSEALAQRGELSIIMEALGRDARAAAGQLALADPATKNRALLAAAEAIRRHQPEILAANQIDMAGGRAKGLSAALLDRLELTPGRIDAMAGGPGARWLELDGSGGPPSADLNWDPA